MDGDRDDAGPDNTLGPSESLDSDEVRNEDGDTVADPPDEWIEAEAGHTLDEKLAAEVPDVMPPRKPAQVRPGRRTSGQIDGTPEDGDSFYTVVGDDQLDTVVGDDQLDTVVGDDQLDTVVGDDELDTVVDK